METLGDLNEKRSTLKITGNVSMITCCGSLVVLLSWRGSFICTAQLVHTSTAKCFMEGKMSSDPKQGKLK